MKDPINRVIDIPIFGKRYLKYFPIDLVSVDKKLLLIKMKIAPPSRGALRAPREWKMILKLFVKIYKIPTQGRQDFKPLNLWEGLNGFFLGERYFLPNL